MGGKILRRLRNRGHYIQTRSSVGGVLWDAVIGTSDEKWVGAWANGRVSLFTLSYFIPITRQKNSAPFSINA